jgi:hypothetical protein
MFPATFLPVIGNTNILLLGLGALLRTAAVGC